MKKVARWLKVELKLVIILLFFSIASILFFVTKRTFDFFPREPEPNIGYLRPADIKKDAHIVNVGMEIVGFPKFNVVKNEFI